MIKCSICGIDKEANEFTDRGKWCHPCRRLKNRQWKENNPDRNNAILKDWRDKNIGKCREYRKKYRISNKNKILQYQKTQFITRRVEQLTQRAIKRGWIKQVEGMEFHHPDYSRVYYGTWIKKSDHAKLHAGLIQCPPCVDYTDRVIKAKSIAIYDGRRRGAIAAAKARTLNRERMEKIGEGK